MTVPEPLARRIAEVARSLQAETGSSETVELAAQLAVGTVEGAEAAAISLVRRGQIIETTAATDEGAITADRIQQDLRDGPAIKAIWDEEVVSCPDIAAEPRWGEWGTRVARETGFGSMLCFRLFTHREQVGALSLFSSQANGFSGADIESGMSFAAHTAIAITVARQDEGKDLALDSRTLIGQATGIVMDRYDLDALRAFAVLRRISQSRNVRIHEVAAELIRTRHLPAQ